MADLKFFADDNGIQNLSGSGIGFFGDSFGKSVSVGDYQDTSYISSADGTEEGPQINNTQWSHPNSGIVNADNDSTHLQDIPNKLATLNIRFTHDSKVKLQNPKLRIYDRSDIDNAASGVTTKVAEIVHLDNTQTSDQRGSGDSSWVTPAGSSVIKDSWSSPSPGLSGQAPNGDETTSKRHDYYTVLSASPDSIGSKTDYGLWFSVEFL